jgi:hypothetical protein
MTSYQEWLKTQSNAVQNDILGTERAARFRDGTLSIEKFDGTKPLTLNDFKSKRELISGKAVTVAK